MKTRKLIAGTLVLSVLGLPSMVSGSVPVASVANPNDLLAIVAGGASVFPDQTRGVVVFANTTRDAVCSPEQLEFENDTGPPPGYGYPKLAPVKVRSTTSSGVWTSQISVSDVHVELWALDGDDLLDIGPCLATADTLDRVATGRGGFRETTASSEVERGIAMFGSSTSTTMVWADIPSYERQRLSWHRTSVCQFTNFYRPAPTQCWLGGSISKWLR
jgi:hypothetical protein